MLPPSRFHREIASLAENVLSVLVLCTPPSGSGWKEHASETRGNFSPLFNGNAVLLGGGAQTDRTFIGRKGFKLAREMYLFPLTQIAGGLSAVSMCRANCARERAGIGEYSNFPTGRIGETRLSHRFEIMRGNISVAVQPALNGICSQLLTF